MFKQFHTIWKNATVNRNQIILSRFVSSTVVKQSESHSQFKRNIKNQVILGGNRSYENHQLRWISNTIKSISLNRSQNVESKYKKMEANLKWRADPVITILETPQFKSILRKNILDLVALFQKYNYEIRIAGGAVR